MREYRGNRDPRLVAKHRGGLLEPSHHRLLAKWAAICAEHVLPLFDAKYPHDIRPRRAIETAFEWSKGTVSVGEARQAAFAAHAAAREVSDPAAREVARAAGHAVAVAHMADHELGAAAYALSAVRIASGKDDSEDLVHEECRWQLNQLPHEIRDLVLSDQSRRAIKFPDVFAC